MAVPTVSRAYREAEQRGLISSTVGRGTFVTGIPTLRDSHDSATIDRSRLDLSVNGPARGEHEQLLRAALAAASTDPDLSPLLTYEADIGGSADRQAATSWLARSGVAVEPGQCVVRWPVVLFLHGQPPSGIRNAGYHRRWVRIAATLARCGYVVVVPSYGAVPPTDDTGPVDAALRDIDWLRTQWSEAEWVHKGAELTAIVGHSYGALLGARVAAARPGFGAFVSLGGTYPHEGVSWPPPVAPSLFMWADGPGTESEQLDQEGSHYTWGSLESPRYAAVYSGQHFDYLDATDTGTAPRGPCQPAHLDGQRLFDGSRQCRLDLRWDVEGTTGSRRLGG